jgi:anti-anti-sigma factor
VPRAGDAQPLRIEVSEDQDAARIVLSGEFDIASADRAGRALQELLGHARQRVVVDLRALDFMDSTGVKFLVEARDAARESGVELALVGGGGSVRRILAVSGIMALFDADARRSGP